ncbi:hypothetical protein Acr_00g0030060 [Actinidia rufa]|uniref:Uncharacterized protein n=1 Tax=Actinidia rufa TaxID=165716 RepID=A0A7J0DEP2_9ERIC|nr:hypothetical protein Acr_00g0030060 [Actinidia rufa]
MVHCRTQLRPSPIPHPHQPPLTGPPPLHPSPSPTLNHQSLLHQPPPSVRLESRLGFRSCANWVVDVDRRWECMWRRRRRRTVFVRREGGKGRRLMCVRRVGRWREVREPLNGSEQASSWVVAGGGRLFGFWEGVVEDGLFAK